MLEAALWGFVGGAALLVGAVLGLTLKVGLRVIGRDGAHRPEDGPAPPCA